MTPLRFARLGLLLVCACLAGGRARAQGAAAPCPSELGEFLKSQGYSAIELSQNTAKQFEVEATLNGKIPLLLLVDTGASMTVFDRDKLKDAGIDVEKTDLQVFGFGGDQRAYSGQIQTLAIGSAQMGVTSILGVDLSDFQKQQKKIGSRPIDGLIGSDFLSRYSAVIEVKHSILYLRTQ
ncbi:MAG TPA: retropepsin-like aspartic protease [Myxococcota bacterium]|nr:retropepsin-like aspartic protease [Myxococcota bacterium]